MLGEILERADAQVEELFRFVEEIQRNLVDQLGELRDGRQVAILTPDLRSRLAADRALVAGAGISLSESAAEGVERLMEWWTIPSDHSLEPHRLQASFDPDNVSFYDYVDTDWYRSALEAKGPVVNGPYVDALGTDENVITLSMPIWEGEEALGVGSLDIRADELSMRIGEQLSRLGVRAALINRERRVIASTSLEHLPGSLIPDDVPVEHRGRLTGWQTTTF